MRKTPPILGESSISSLEKIKLGGIDQWILLRGNNVYNPIVLFLHGGPGNAQIGFAPAFQEQLEKHFLVVNWDQRGAGLSFCDQIKKETMSIDQFIKDAKQLISYLLNRFQRQKLFLVGHSWGSILGMKLIEKYPQFFHAYIGVGQIVHMLEGEKISYDYTLSYAKKHHVQEAIEQLTTIGPPPYENELEGLVTQRKWLNQFHGVMANNTDFFEFTLEIIENRTEYKKDDVNKLLKGIPFSIITLWPEVLRINFFQRIKKVNVPIYFLLGELDYNTPNILVKKFYEQLVAPKKEVIYFKNVAHHLPFENPEKFTNTLYLIAKETFL